jgi:hypothetical protein
MATADHRISDEIDRLIARLGSLTADDVQFLADLWRQEDSAARQRAWASAKPAIEAAGNSDVLMEVREAVGAWMKASRADFSGIEGLLGAPGGIAGGRRAAAPAVVDAAAAIVAGAALDETEREVLSRPWEVLTGEETRHSNE